MLWVSHVSHMCSEFRHIVYWGCRRAKIVYQSCLFHPCIWIWMHPRTPWELTSQKASQLQQSQQSVWQSPGPLLFHLQNLETNWRSWSCLVSGLLKCKNETRFLWWWGLDFPIKLCDEYFHKLNELKLMFQSLYKHQLMIKVFLQKILHGQKYTVITNFSIFWTLQC